jgi:hypothetical protein
MMNRGASLSGIIITLKKGKSDDESGGWPGRLSSSFSGA